MRARAGDDAPESSVFAPGSELPYGAVMASAGASMVAGSCGLRSMAAPLLAWAVLQALWVPGRATRQLGIRGGWRAWRTPSGARRLAAMHTVPLGLAVIAGGFARLALGRPAAGLVPAASITLALAWLFTLTCLARFLHSLPVLGVALREMDGTWFLVPAALLGVGIATDLLARSLGASAGAGFEAPARVAILAGWLGYWIIAAVAALRIARHGLGRVPRAPWWIAMGCAGLAAAGLGHVVATIAPGAPVAVSLRCATLVTTWVAIVLYAPVLAGSAAFLLQRCRFRARGAWAPTFSTAVFALGCLAAGEVSGRAAYTLLGHVAGYVTIAFWAFTTAWNARCAWPGMRGPRAPRGRATR